MRLTTAIGALLMLEQASSSSSSNNQHNQQNDYKGLGFRKSLTERKQRFLSSRKQNENRRKNGKVPIVNHIHDALNSASILKETNDQQKKPVEKLVNDRTLSEHHLHLHHKKIHSTNNNKQQGLLQNTITPAAAAAASTVDQEMKECDPSTGDVGILGCDTNEICRIDPTSKLGGICDVASPGLFDDGKLADEEDTSNTMLLYESTANPNATEEIDYVYGTYNDDDDDAGYRYNRPIDNIEISEIQALCSPLLAETPDADSSGLECDCSQFDYDNAVGTISCDVSFSYYSCTNATTTYCQEPNFVGIIAEDETYSLEYCVNTWYAYGDGYTISYCCDKEFDINNNTKTVCVESGLGEIYQYFYCSDQYDQFEPLPVDCNCDAFNASAFTGLIQCQSETYCMQPFYSDTCFSYTLDITFSGLYLLNETACFNFVAPETQSVCYSSYIGNGNDDLCGISINGEDCDSCQTGRGFYDRVSSKTRRQLEDYNYDYYSYFDPEFFFDCHVHDCTNTALGISGSTCNENETAMTLVTRDGLNEWLDYRFGSNYTYEMIDPVSMNDTTTENDNETGNGGQNSGGDDNGGSDSDTDGTGASGGDDGAQTTSPPPAQPQNTGELKFVLLTSGDMTQEELGLVDDTVFDTILSDSPNGFFSGEVAVDPTFSSEATPAEATDGTFSLETSFTPSPGTSIPSDLKYYVYDANNGLLASGPVNADGSFSLNVENLPSGKTLLLIAFSSPSTGQGGGARRQLARALEGATAVRATMTIWVETKASPVITSAPTMSQAPSAAPTEIDESGVMSWKSGVGGSTMMAMGLAWMGYAVLSGL